MLTPQVPEEVCSRSWLHWTWRSPVTYLIFWYFVANSFPEILKEVIMKITLMLTREAIAKVWRYRVIASCLLKMNHWWRCRWVRLAKYFNTPLFYGELQCDYYNWGHLDKVDQLDYRKITIHLEKVSCVNNKLPWNEKNNMDRNQPITTHRHVLLNLWRKPVFPERSLNGGWVSHVTSKHGNAMVAKKLLVDNKIPACVKEIMSPGCYM